MVEMSRARSGKEECTASIPVDLRAAGGGHHSPGSPTRKFSEL